MSRVVWKLEGVPAMTIARLVDIQRRSWIRFDLVSSSTELLFETPYTGGVIGSVDIHPLYLLRRHSLSERIVFVCEIISLFFVAYYIVKEIISAS
ncbi:Polycystin-2 [Taenia solium]|eukprot:TsM_000714700 transcript=TsM_000714700 gene=TsM_000714700